MKIKNLDESGVIKSIVICNDMFFIVFSYWIVFALSHSFSLASHFPFTLEIELIIAALIIFPCHAISQPVFLKHIARNRDILMRAIYTSFIQAFFMFIISNSIRQTHVGKVEIVGASLIFFVLLYSERTLAHVYLKRQRSKGHNLRNVILVGHPRELLDIYQTLKDKSLGFKVLGIFTRQDVPPEMKIPNLGMRSDVLKYIEDHTNITDIYIVPDPVYIKETEEIFSFCENHLIRFYALPVFLDFLTRKMCLSHFGNTMLLTARDEPLQNPLNRLWKRVLDIFISGISLITVFPIAYLFAAIIIKIQSPGPVFFKQKRNGLDGKEFICYKFRSMHVNIDADRLQASKDDPRKFKFGNFMRATNIDEFPQLINVLLGNMSLVGPRPHMLLHTEEYSHLINRYMVRHYVKPGITGWAQVQGFRGETKTLEQMGNRIKADIWYVENWSILLDIRIIWRTFINMIKHNEENAY